MTLWIRAPANLGSPPWDIASHHSDGPWPQSPKPRHMLSDFLQSCQWGVFLENKFTDTGKHIVKVTNFACTFSRPFVVPREVTAMLARRKSPHQLQAGTTHACEKAARRGLFDGSGRNPLVTIATARPESRSPQPTDVPAPVWPKVWLFAVPESPILGCPRASPRDRRL